MARIRTIKPEFWSDGTLMECSLNARLLFIGTWNFADDYGNLDRSAKQIKARVFPADPIDCEPLIQELLTHGRLIEYSVNEKKYLHIHKFLEHQVINRPGKPHCPSYEPSLNTPGELRDDSGLKGREGKGREGKGEDKTLVREQSSLTTRAVEVIPLKTGQQYPVQSDFIDHLASAYPAVDVPQTLKEIKAWMVANPTRQKTKSGIRRCINSWMQREQEKHGAQA